ncbi:MAG: hypothetical protein AAB367_03520 [Patescibacteria group bacterium]
MKNTKLEKKLLGREWWKGSKVLSVAGVLGAPMFSSNMTDEEKEKIIQSWNTIAVIEANPKNIPFHIGFIREDDIWILKYPLETLDGKFGMRVGQNDLKLFGIHISVEEAIQLSLVEVVDEKDPRYSELPLY